MEDKKKLFVASLTWGTTEKQLLELFSASGKVLNVTIVKNHETGLSRGFAFITMETEEDAQQAIKDLDGIALDKRNIRVSIALPRQNG